MKAVLNSENASCSVHLIIDPWPIDGPSIKYSSAPPTVACPTGLVRQFKRKIQRDLTGRL